MRGSYHDSNTLQIAHLKRFVSCPVMYPPVDYPLSEQVSPDTNTPDLSYANLLNRHAEAQPITRSMIQSARTGLETAHQVPEAPKAIIVGEQSTKPVLKRLLNAIR